MVNEQMTNTAADGMRREKKRTQRKNSHEAFCRTSLKFNVNLKKRPWLKVSKVRETVLEFKLSNPELV